MSQVLNSKVLIISLLVGCAACFSSFEGLAQGLEVKGTVIDGDTNETLPGVNIQIKGTSNGTSTDLDGNYSLNVNDSDAVLIFSFIGYANQEITVNNRSIINVQMEASLETLSEVVVTALGIERETKSLGYASQNITGEQLTQARETNVINSLSGKIAGVQINQAGTGVGGTSKVVIRGFSSIDGNNSPLYVIDGVPMQNPQGGGAQFGGVDYGDGISNINANDIESMNVLKGASATALYGSRGQNGVIMITTKKGKARKGIGVEINSNYTIEQGLVFPEFQNKFGRGSNGNYPIVDGTFNDGTIDNWGPLMKGQLLPNWTGDTTAYSPQPNNIEDFFRLGSTLSNSLALSGGNDKTQARVSISHLKNKGIMPNSELERLNINLNVSTELTDKITLDAKANYIKQDVFNRPNLALSPDNPMNSLISMPRNIRLADLKNFQTPLGEPRLYTNGASTNWQNPYWAVNLNTNDDTRERIIGYLKLEYQISEWLKVHLRSGTDYYYDFRQNRNASNTIYRISPDQSFYREYYGRNSEINTDILFSSFNKINEKWSLSANLGANALHINSKNTTTTAQGLNIPNFFVMQNALSSVTSEGIGEKKVYSIYGAATVEYNNYLFIEASARNDWSSALPPDNWSYFYPGVSASFVLTDAIDINWGLMNFGKIRGSVAGVGNDTSPGRLQTLFTVNTLNHGGQTFGQIAPTRATTDLKPERTTSIEAGFDLGFFQNRVKTSFTYYTAGTTNQILAVPVSKPSGFDNVLFNAGLIQNEGIEITLDLTPVELDNFQYDTYINFTKNVSTVKELADDVEVYPLGNEYGQFNVQILAEVGGEFGDIYANKSYLRDSVSGERIIGPEGFPLEAGRKKIGNYQPDFLMGWGHNLKYRNFTFSVLFDARKGGDIFSYSNATAAFNGNAFNTRNDRLEWYAGAGGYIAEGINQDGSPNTIEVDPQSYWQIVGGRSTLFGEEFIYDGSFIKLREMTLGYTFPENFLGNNFIRNLRVSLVGRNLFILYKNTPGFDPEATFTSGNDQGIEAFAFPSTRSVGLNINLSL